MLCKYCGNEIENGLPFCLFCGRDVSDESQPEESSAAESMEPEAIWDAQPAADEAMELSAQAEELPAGNGAEAEIVQEPAAQTVKKDIEQGASDVAEDAVEPDEKYLKKQQRKKKAHTNRKIKKDNAALASYTGGKAGGIVVAILILAALAVGGYFGYINFLSPEARFASAMKKGSESLADGEFVDAVDHFSTAIEIDAKAAEAYILRGDAYLADGDSADAIDDYIKAYFIDTENVELCVKIGDAYYSEKIYESALEYYTTAVAKDPTDASVYAKISDTYLALGSRDMAIDILNQGVAATGDAPLTYTLNNLVNSKYEDFIAEAEARAESDDLDGAHYAYTAAIATDSERSEAYYARARINALLEDYAAAAEDYETAIALGEQSADAYIAYAQVCMILVDNGQEQLDRVVSILEEGWSVSGNEEILLMLTDVVPSVAPGDYEEAFELELSSLSEIYYTLDGSEPTTLSHRYTGSITIAVGDTTVKLVAVSPAGVSGSVITLAYNVTTLEMKAMAAFEEYFNSMFNDEDHEVLVLDVTNDGLQDMIIVDVNPDDDDLYRIRVYVFDGTNANPIYMNSKVTAENLHLCIYNDRYCFMSYSSETEEVDDKDVRTDKYVIFGITEDGDTDELKTYTVKYEDKKETESDLDESEYELIDIIGVPHMSADAFGHYTVPDDEYAVGSADVVYYNGRYYSTDENLTQALPNCTFIDVDTPLFVIGDGVVYYYQADDSGENAIYKMTLGTDTAVRLGDGDGETLIYSGGWLYVGDDTRYDTASGASVTDKYDGVDELVAMDGSYLYYEPDDSYALIRADRDLSGAVEILPEHEDSYNYFTYEGRLYIYDNDKTPQLDAYTVNGSYVYAVDLDLKSLSDSYVVSGGVLYVLSDETIVAIDLDNAKVIRQIDLDGQITDDDTFVCGGAGKLVIADYKDEGTYHIVDVTEGTLGTVTIKTEEPEAN